MPTTPLTPEQTFGFGSVPIASYFKGPKKGSADTRFSPQARAMLQQQENYDQYERQREADQLVNDLLGQAATMDDQQINQTLLQNPQAFRSMGLGNLQNYQSFRQQASPTALSDKNLGLYHYSQLAQNKDPRQLENYQRRVLEEGMSPTDAWQAYRRDQFNEPLAQQLAEAGIGREEFEALRTPNGYFDPVEVSRRVAQAEAEKSRARSAVKDTLDQEMTILTDTVSRLDKAIEAETMGAGRKDVVDRLTVQRDGYAQRLQQATDEKLTKLRPPPATDTTTEVDARIKIPGTTKPSAFLQKALEIQQIPVR